MAQTKVGVSRSKWLVFVKKLGVAWRQGKDALLIVLLQEILEENHENDDAAAYQTTINALRDLINAPVPIFQVQEADVHLNGFVTAVPPEESS